jgi:hypothetical protein
VLTVYFFAPAVEEKAYEAPEAQAQEDEAEV